MPRPLRNGLRSQGRIHQLRQLPMSNDAIPRRNDQAQFRGAPLNHAAAIDLGLSHYWTGGLGKWTFYRSNPDLLPIVGPGDASCRASEVELLGAVYGSRDYPWGFRADDAHRPLESRDDVFKTGDEQYMVNQ